MDNSLLSQILHEYEIKRENAIKDANNRKQELIKVNPRLVELDNEIAQNSFKATKELLFAKEEDKAKILSNLEKKNNKLIKEKNTFLKSISKDTNYLNPHFECNMCNDTGYITKEGSTQMCSCLKQKIFDAAYNKSNMGNLEIENFNNFDLRIFSDKPDPDLYKSDISPRDNIKNIKDKVQTFINNFDNPEEKNIILTGTTGVGKTYLINCIANEILKSGKTVLYQTAPVMFDEINEAKFSQDSKGFNLYENILNVDLLIIDDLGTEKISDSKISELFTIVNTRLLNQNHKITKTIISTNLNITDLFNTYTSRIGSRFTGYYKFYKLYGEDLRFKKAKK